MRTAFLFVVILLAGCVDNPYGTPSPQRLSQWYQDEEAFVPSATWRSSAPPGMDGSVSGVFAQVH